jgi:Protein of unknown function (DUF3306)
MVDANKVAPAEPEAGFLGRWSRRKADVRAGKPLVEPVVVAKPAEPANSAQHLKFKENNGNVSVAGSYLATDNVVKAAPPELPALTLEDAKALTKDSDFKPFMAKSVSPEVKNAAMKKLFTDPHFNVMDMMDTYVDDYSKSDPIPMEMLKEMTASKFLRLFERDDEEAKEEPTIKEAAKTAIEGEESRDDAYTQAPQTVAQLEDQPLANSQDIIQPLTPSQPVDPVASQANHDHPDLRLQPDHALERQSPRAGAG